MDLAKRRIYDSVHKWIYQYHGKATKCEMEGCAGIAKRMEWALKKGFEYEKKIENFWQLCASCHRKYDWTVEQSRKVSEALRKREYTAELRRNMARGQQGRVLPPEVREKIAEGQRKRWAAYSPERRAEICSCLSQGHKKS